MSTSKPLSHLRGGRAVTQRAEADRVGKLPLVRDGAADRGEISARGSVALAMYVAVMLLLVGFGIAASAVATPLFKRTL